MATVFHSAFPDLFEIRREGLREVVDLQFRSLLRALRNELKREPVSGLNILDFGAGRSPYRGLFSQARNYLSVDPLDPRADCREMPSSVKFDRILCLEVLEHVSEPTKILRQLKDKLHPEGKIWISVPFAARVHGAPDDFRRWTAEGLRRELETAGLEVERIEPRGNAFSAITSKILFLGFQCLRRPVYWPLGIPLALLAAGFLPISWLTFSLPVDDPLGYFLVAKVPKFPKENDQS